MATSKSKITNEFELTLSGEAGADHAFSMEGISDGAGRVSVQIDLGAAPRPSIFQYYPSLLWQASPVQFGVGSFYKAEAPDGDATQIPGDIGNADAALGDIDQITNLDFIGTITAEEANTTKMVGEPLTFKAMSRFLTLVFFNEGGSTTNATDSNCTSILIGRTDQGQDS